MHWVGIFTLGKCTFTEHFYYTRLLRHDIKETALNMRHTVLHNLNYVKTIVKGGFADPEVGMPT